LPIEEGDHVFHLAGKTGVAGSWVTPSEYYELNVVGTARVLDHCKNAGASMSYASAYVYGQPRDLPISEADTPFPDNPYAQSKLLGEQICQFYAEHFGLSVIALRLFNIYGPYQSDEFVIPRILRQLLDPSQSSIELNDLEPKRDFVFVADVVEAFLRSAPPKDFGVFNVGSGRSYSIADIIKFARALTGIQKTVTSSVLKRRNEISDVVADYTKIFNEYGWRPATDIRHGLRLVINAIR